jgi:hypothetical protein
MSVHPMLHNMIPSIFQLRDTARPPFSRYETAFGSECQVIPKQLFVLLLRPWRVYRATFENFLKRVSFADLPSLTRNRILMICEAELQRSRESFTEPVNRILGNHSPGGQEFLDHLWFDGCCHFTGKDSENGPSLSPIIVHAPVLTPWEHSFAEQV